MENSKKGSAKKWRDAHPEEYKVSYKKSNKKWAEANRKKVLEIKEKSRKKQRMLNPERFRAASFNLRYKKYNLTYDDFKKMVASQDGMCLICGSIPDEADRMHPILCVDHEHKTNKIRGLLCHRCNTGIGQFNDNPELINKAILYLKKWRGI